MDVKVFGRELKYTKYDVPLCYSCLKMTIQQVNLLGLVHILKPYAFKSDFHAVVCCLVLQDSCRHLKVDC